MPTVHLTKRTIAALAPSPSIDLYWDEGLPGFGVRVSPGGTKAYIVQYRDRGATKRKTIGTVETVALDRARKAAGDMLATVRLGVAIPTRQSGGPLFGAVLDDFLRFTEAKRSPRTASDYRKRADAKLRPEFGEKRIRHIARADIEKFHEGLADTPRSANYLLAIISGVYSYAVRVKIIADGDHPARRIPKYRENRRTRHLSLEEVAAFGSALAALEAERKVSPWAAAALRLLIITGARHGEILSLQWAHVDLAGGVLNLPTSKTGPKRIRLAAAAVAVIESVPKIEGTPYVIAGRHHGEPMKSLQKPFEVTVAKAGLEHVRIHDLRHTAASVATSAGVGLPILGKLLGQSQSFTTERYSHIAADAERAAAEVIAGKVGPLLLPRPKRPA